MSVTMAAHSYGADLTPKQFVMLCIALCTGTLIEWFDFTIYSQLSSTLTQEFFPASNPTAQQLSYWAVFALGFIARPVGSIVFGHIGDSHGRRMTLLISILCVSLPTILLGCLPTYSQIGIAAPVLMALLRFIQGLAVGGEFGSAIVYLYEMAPKHRKGTIASLGQAAIAPGIGAGLIACLVVMYACTPAQLALWGWRIPFLLTAFFAPVALVLRMHMPEPHEFLASKQQMVMERVASKAASRAAASFTRLHCTAARAPSRVNSRQLSRRLQTLTEVVVLPTVGQGGAVAGDLESQHDADSKDRFKAVSTLQTANSGEPASLSTVRSLSVSQVAPPSSNIQTTEVKLHVPHLGSSKAHETVQHGAQHAEHALHDQELDEAVLGCEEAYAAEVQHSTQVVKHHVPLLVLARDHWQGVLLQFLLEANYGATFYTFFSWVPTYLRQLSHRPPQDTLWPLLVAMLLFPIVVVLTGRHISDRAIPKMYVFMGITAFNAAVSIPLLLYLHSGSVVAQWLLLPLMLGVTGVCGGLMTSIGPQIFPAAVRTSGYNLAHNLAMSLFGGFVPMAISALAIRLPPAALSAGVVLVITAVITWAAAVPLIKLAPQINTRAPVGGF